MNHKEKCKSKVWLTSIDNIDQNNKLINTDEVICREYLSYLDAMDFFSIIDNSIRKDFFINCSLFDDFLIIDNIKYKILKMTTY